MDTYFNSILLKNGNILLLKSCDKELWLYNTTNYELEMIYKCRNDKYHHIRHSMLEYLPNKIIFLTKIRINKENMYESILFDINKKEIIKTISHDFITDYKIYLGDIYFIDSGDGYKYDLENNMLDKLHSSKTFYFCGFMHTENRSLVKHNLENFKREDFTNILKDNSIWNLIELNHNKIIYIKSSDRNHYFRNTFHIYNMQKQKIEYEYLNPINEIIINIHSINNKYFVIGQKNIYKYDIFINTPINKINFCDVIFL